MKYVYTDARSTNPPWDVDLPPETEEWPDDLQEDEESAADDSVSSKIY